VKRLLYFVVMLFGLNSSNPALAMTNVLITVDVESFQAGNPDKNIWGRLPGYEGEHGIPLILDIFQENNAKTTFYLNVYEMSKHGESAIRQVAEEIVNRGQSLELHTHPAPMFGRARMVSYDSNKQEEIIRKGQQLILEWTGRNVIAHRAGAYYGNTDTIHAVKRAGIFVDASLSPASLSPLYKEGYAGNDAFEIDGVLELPLTYFTQLKFNDWQSTRFLDIESTSLRELKSVLDAMAEKGSCMANIMMHSFSFTRYGYPDERISKKLDALLKYIQEHPKLTTTDTESFFKAYKDNSLSCEPTPEFVPHTGIILTYLRSWERFNDGWKNRVLALSIPALIGFLLLSALLWRYLAKRSRQRS